MTGLLHLDAGDPSSLEDLLDQAAKDLADNMAAGNTDRYERTLAEKVLARYTGTDALDVLVASRLEDLIGVDCLLNQGDDTSYEVIDKMQAILVDGIRTQGGEQLASVFLATDQIISGEKVDRMLRELHEKLAGGGAS